jgi:hypothetical protein
MKPFHITAPFGAPRAGRAHPRPASLLDVCAALFLTLAGLLGREGIADGA